MSRLKLDQEAMGLCSLAEKIMHVQVKDCFKEQEMIYFIVGMGEIGKAIGKGGMNVKRLQQEFSKRIKIIEYNDNVVQFVRNVIYPLQVREIEEKEGCVLLKDDNKKTKSLLIGRESGNLSVINRAVRRFFAVDVKVV